mmetsp:Transcript_21955/g.19507  ORF Transcript_21955/g.19507 Transcript_21955/m.19507 type:complete len:139 (+) Transcript_21955:552-968(+)
MNKYRIFQALKVYIVKERMKDKHTANLLNRVLHKKRWNLKTNIIKSWREMAKNSTDKKGLTEADLVERMPKIVKIFINYYHKEKYRNMVNVKAEYKIKSKLTNKLVSKSFFGWKRIQKSNKLENLILMKCDEHRNNYI